MVVIDTVYVAMYLQHTCILVYSHSTSCCSLNLYFSCIIIFSVLHWLKEVQFCTVILPVWESVCVCVCMLHQQHNTIYTCSLMSTLLVPSILVLMVTGCLLLCLCYLDTSGHAILAALSLKHRVKESGEGLLGLELLEHSQIHLITCYSVTLRFKDISTAGLGG